MRRWSLALLLTLASPALAQTPEPAQAPPAAAPEPKAEPPAPKAEPPAPKAEPPAAATPAPTAPVPVAPAPTPAAPVPEAKTPPATPPPTAKPAPAAPAPAPTAPPAVAAPAQPARPPVPLSVQLPPPTMGDDSKLTAEEYARKLVKDEARFIFENLLAGDARTAVSELGYPFQLEDKRYNTPEELVAAWVKQLRQKRTDLITLYDIEVLSLAEMEKKYGKSPARLGLGTLKEPGIYAAVGNLSGRAAVLLFRAPTGSSPVAFAYTD